MHIIHALIPYGCLELEIVGIADCGEIEDRTGAGKGREGGEREEGDERKKGRQKERKEGRDGERANGWQG